MTNLSQVFKKVDWKLLNAQKAWLLGQEQQSEEAAGLVNLLDAIQDAVVSDRLAEVSDVFGTPLAALVALAQQAGDDCLDDLVHETAQECGLGELNSIEDDEGQEAHISAVEVAASNINNEGHEGQIRYLLAEGVDEEDIRAAIRGE